jgi:hypothetical protein
MGAFTRAGAILYFSAGVAFAQVEAEPGPAGTTRSLAEGLVKPSAHEAAVAECEGMWDRGTHMTRKEWSQTCRRVQDRLRRLDAK